MGSGEAAAERKAEAYAMYVEALSEARTKYQPKSERLQREIKGGSMGTNAKRVERSEMTLVETKDKRAPAPDDIMAAHTKIEDFFNTQLQKEGAVKKVSRTNTGWFGLYEALEENEVLKRKGHVGLFDKVVYSIKLDPKLKITSYGIYDRENPQEEEK